MITAITTNVVSKINATKPNCKKVSFGISNAEKCDEVCFSYSKKPLKCLSDLRSVLKDERHFEPKNVLNIFDNIKRMSDSEKALFLRLYCFETGFPDMKKTSKKIEKDVVMALKKAEKLSNSEILVAGYNPTCSVGNNHALPGSDFDTFFICLKDTSKKGDFKNTFKQSVNPLLCSMTYNRTNDMPDIVSIDEIEKSIDLANQAFDKNGLAQNQDEYSSILKKQIKDWTYAGKYNLDLNKFIPDEEKTPLLRAGLLMEILRDGAVIVDNLSDKRREKMINSVPYKYSNMQQMGSYKNAPLKMKHQNREAILGNFKNLDTEEQLDLIFDIIKISVKDLKKDVSDNAATMFKDSGCGNMEDLIQPLLSYEHRLPDYK